MFVTDQGTDVSVPYRDHGYYYSTRTEKGATPFGYGERLGERARAGFP
jgi:hypothetical protein